MRRPTEAETTDALCERVLASCLARAGAQIEEAIEVACRVHPEIAAQLRERYRILLDSGILEEEQGGQQA
ncbi:MAG: hypothetical protein R3F30_07880 [Planctomycetota bacterium]